MSKIRDEFDTTTNEGWINELAFQLRLRGATGAETGSAMAEVEAHLADSGESASEAFGDPRAYAATLLPKSRREGIGTYLGSLFVGVAAFVAFFLIVDAVRFWGGDVPIQAGMLVSLAVMAVLVGVLSVFGGEILGSKKLWALAVWFIVAFAALIVPAVAMRGMVVGAVPAPLALLIALALLVGAGFYLFKLANDPIRDPRTVALDADERALIVAGHELEAMKAYRARTRATLAQAKSAVDAEKGRSAR